MHPTYMRCEKRRKQWLAALAASLALASVGTEEYWIWHSLTKLMHSVAEEKYNVHVIVAGCFVAAITSISIGASLGAYCADKYGRKITLLSTAIFALVQITGMMFDRVAWSLTTLYIGEIGIAMTRTVLPLYISEIADDEIRGGLLLLQKVNFYGGKLLVAAFSPFVSAKAFGVIAMFLPVVFVVTFSWCPETPHYFVMERRYEKAKTSLSFFKQTDQCGTNEALNDVTRTIEANGDCDGWCSKFRNLFHGRNFKGLILILALIIVRWTDERFDTQISAVHTIYDILDQNLSRVTFVDYAITFLGSIVLVCTIDIVGRRTSLLGASIISFVVGWTFLLVLIGDNWLFKILQVVLHLSQMILSSVPLIYVGEFFSTHVKALASAIIVIFEIIVRLSIASLDGMSDYRWNSYFYGILIILAVPLVLLFIPETKKKTHFEIQNELSFKLIWRPTCGSK